MKTKICFVILGVLMLAVILLACPAWGQTKPRAATLAQQKMCAVQAQKVFNERRIKEGKHLNWSESFTSHYEGSTNVCYVMERTARMPIDLAYGDQHTITTISVVDAFEGRTYAFFNGDGNQSHHGPTCWFKPHGNELIFCVSDTSFHGLESEFDAIVYKYLGISE